MEIVQERIRREYDLDVISTYPSVVYKVMKTDGIELLVDNRLHLPEPSSIDYIQEPMIRAMIHIPNESIGDMLMLISEKRGTCLQTDTVDQHRVMLCCELPLNEVLVDFNDRLKSITKEYGSMDYELDEYRTSNLVRMDLLVNREGNRCFFIDCTPGQSGSQGAGIMSKAERNFTATAFCRSDSSGHREYDYSAGDVECGTEGCDSKVL
jgi:GTP-binding protein LepA